jgi:hypothetical protein
MTLCERVAPPIQPTGLLTFSVRHPSQQPGCPYRTRAERSDSPPLNPGTATGGRSLSPAFTRNHGRPFRARTMGEDAALPSVLLHVPASRAPPPVRRIADPRLAVDSTAAIVHARLQNLELGRRRDRTDEGCAALGFKWAEEPVGRRHKLGGAPDWLQEADVPCCPSCRAAMTFYAQLDSIGSAPQSPSCWRTWGIHVSDSAQTTMSGKRPEMKPGTL